MSAEVLRVAAEAIRFDMTDYTGAWSLLPDALAPALADWLDDEAEWGGCEGCGHTQRRCDLWAAEPDTIKCCPDCKHAPHALAVVRAYLGESA